MEPESIGFSPNKDLLFVVDLFCLTKVAEGIDWELEASYILAKVKALLTEFG